MLLMRDVEQAEAAERVAVGASEHRLAKMSAEAVGAFLAVAVGQALAARIVTFLDSAAAILRTGEIVAFSEPER